jgi:hypothetical protein
MPDLGDFFRWQWLWRSRRRLFTVGLVVFLSGAGLLALLIATWMWGRPNRNIARGLIAPVILMGLGGFGMCQAAFSGGRAFGDHDAPDPTRRTLPPVPRSKRPRRRADDQPIPLANTAAATPLKVTRCPTCHEPMTVPADEVAECPKCHERFRPD